MTIRSLEPYMWSGDSRNRNLQVSLNKFNIPKFDGTRAKVKNLQSIVTVMKLRMDVIKEDDIKIKTLMDFWLEQEGIWKTLIDAEPPDGVGLKAFMKIDGSGLDAYMKKVVETLFPNEYEDGKAHHQAVIQGPHCPYSRQSGETMIGFFLRRTKLIDDLKTLYGDVYKMPEEFHARMMLDHANIPSSEKHYIELHIANSWTIANVKRVF